MTHSDHPTPTQPPPRKPLRLWPGVVAAVLLVVIRFVVPLVVSEAIPFAMIGAVVAALAIFAWWVFFSRAPWSERLGGLGLMIAALFATSRVVHASIAGGAMGALLYVWAIPFSSVALHPGPPPQPRTLQHSARASMVATILLACGVWTLIRTDGVTSNLIGSEFRWRWTPTAEQRLLADARAEPVAPAAVPAAPLTSESPAPGPANAADKPLDSATGRRESWGGTADPRRQPPRRRRGPVPGFCAGPVGNARVGSSNENHCRVAGSRGTRIATASSAACGSRPTGPRRHQSTVAPAIGPGWSSVAVAATSSTPRSSAANDEVVACYNAPPASRCGRTATGPVRRVERRAPARAGRRRSATAGLHAWRDRHPERARRRAPAPSSGRATPRPTPASRLPVWGFSTSPLVVGDLVVAAALRRPLAAYDAAHRTSPLDRSHRPRCAQLCRTCVTIGGVPQVLLVTAAGARPASRSRTAVRCGSTTGRVAPIVQPAAVTARATS